MRKTLFFFFSLFTLIIFLGGNANAQLLIDNFDYSGMLNANGWSVHSGGGTNSISTTTGLVYSGYTGSGVGNAALIGNAGGEDVNRDFTPQNTDGTSIYFSVLVNVNDAASSKSGDYFINIGNEINPTSFTYFAARIFAKISSDAVNFGISNTSTASYGTTSFLKNTTYLLIVKYTINTAGNDAVSLWVKSTGIPSSEVAAGTPELTNSTTAGQDIINAFALRQGSSSSSPQVVVDGIRLGTSWADLFPPVSNSIITVSPSTLSNFTYAPGAGPSAYQSYNLSGSGLTPTSGNLTITGSNNYEVSLNHSTFSSSINVAYTSGTLNTTPVYVRLKSGLAAGDYSGELITNSGGGAITQSVTCNGAVIKSEPTNHVTNFTGVLGNPYYYTNLSWTDAAGGIIPDGYLVKSSNVDFSSITDPVDGVPESNSYTSLNVEPGIGAAVFTGFSSSIYYYKIYPYTNSGSFINYKTSGSVPQFTITTTSAPALPIIENFNYTTGSNITDNGWVAHSGAGNFPIKVNASPLTYSGYVNSGIGKSVSLSAPGTASAEDDNRVFAGVTSNSLYASFLVNVSSADVSGVYFFHFGPENSTSAFFGKVFVKNDGGGNLAFGVAKNSNSDAVYTSFSYSLNTTYLIVVKYTFNTGSTTDDEAKLWVNPVLNGTEPAANVTQTDAQTDATELGFFALRQASSGPALTLGGIRIATDWFSSQSSTFTSQYTFSSGWNLVSFPGIHPNSMNVDTLFRGRDNSASVFYYNGSYQIETTAHLARGYWLKMSSNRVFKWDGTVQGGILYPELSYGTVTPITATSGWNLIGVYEYQINPADITTVPAGLITNAIYKYNPGTGYSVASLMDRAQGFWVYMNGAGQIVLPGRSLQKSSADMKNPIDKNWGKIIITDSEGKSYTLYCSGQSSFKENGFLLPPAPPSGVFDVRYSSQKLVEDLSSEKEINISNAVYPITVKTENVELNIKDGFTGKIFNRILKDGEQVTINDNSINKIIVDGKESIPVSFNLEQNYPNPFNPTTKISYDLPDETNVTLKVFNSLGQEVMTLVNEQKQQAGRYQVTFNSAGLASGIYLYKIQAGNFVQTKKMILMK